MANKTSAGILMYKKTGSRPEFLLAHPGGPYFKNKDDGYWSIPKGEISDDSDLLREAIREFSEETGNTPQGSFVPLGLVKQNNGKVIHAWAAEGDLKQEFKSNTFNIEWPPRSGKTQAFPEIDKTAFFTAEIAKQKINSAQAAFIDRLLEYLKQTTQFR